MQLLKAAIIFSMILVAGGIHNETFDGVCLETKTFQEVIPTKVYKPRLRKKTEWCLSLSNFFRCDSTYTAWEYEIENKVYNKMKTVKKCCDGYVSVNSGKCLPSCSKGCVNGGCVAPETCDCVSGFHGKQCEQTCPEGLWGKNCLNVCDCSDNGKCSKTSGKCNCEPGWRGDRCEAPCQEHYFGYYCMQKCNCNGYFCDHKTGECITTTEVTTTTNTPDTTTTTAGSDSTSSEAFESTTFSSTTTNMYSITQTSDVIEGVINRTRINAAETGTVNAFASETIGTKEVKLLQVTKSGKSAAGKTPSDLRASTEEATTAEMAKEKAILHEIGIKATHSNKNQIDLSPETFEKNFKPEQTEATNTTGNKPTSTSFNGRHLDKNKTEFLISDIKETADNKTRPDISNFLPSLIVISTTSFLIIIIGASWLTKKYWRKSGKMEVTSEKKQKMVHSEESENFQAEPVSWANYISENPVYPMDANLTNRTLILKTFNPDHSDKSFTSEEKN